MARSVLLPPKLLPNESPANFRARVRAWQQATGKQYPKSFSGKSTTEERLLSGELLYGTWGTKYNQDLSESDLDDYKREISTAQSVANQKDPKWRMQQSLKQLDIQDAKREKWLTDFNMAKVREIQREMQAEDAKEQTNVTKEINDRNKYKKAGLSSIPTGEQVIKDAIPNPDSKTDEELENTKAPGWSNVFHTLDEDGNPMVLTGNQRKNFEKEFADIPIDELPNRNRNRWIWGG